MKGYPSKKWANAPPSLVECSYVAFHCAYDKRASNVKNDNNRQKIPYRKQDNDML